MKERYIKRTNTFISKYGKGSNYGSEESILKNFKSVLFNRMNFSNEELSLKSSEEIKKLYGDYVRSQSKNRIIKRIHNLFNIPISDIQSFDDATFNEYKKKCYISALINRGRSMVIEYNLGDPTVMTDAELLKYSGYKKKINGKGKLIENKRKRIITHLANYYKLEKDSFSEFTNEEIYEKHKIYLHESGRLKKLIEAGGGGKWKKGYVNLNRLGLTIFFRSSYEKYFLNECDKNLFIKNIEFNLNGIHYIFNGSNCWYFPDFIILYNDGKKIMIEIKSNWQLNDEKTQQKIKAGIEYCKNNNMIFKVLTEDELFNKEKNIWEQL